MIRVVYPLTGYCPPDDHFTPMVKETVQKLMSVLRDPNLPLLELQVCLTSHLPNRTFFHKVSLHQRHCLVETTFITCFVGHFMFYQCSLQ